MRYRNDWLTRTKQCFRDACCVMSSSVVHWRITRQVFGRSALPLNRLPVICVCKLHSFRLVCSGDNKPFSGVPRSTSSQQQHACNFGWIFLPQFAVPAFRFEFWNLEVIEICRFYYCATYVLFLLFGVRIKLPFLCSLIICHRNWCQMGSSSLSC
jgi:hypothetical protein